jgi:hypothetical protein
VVDDGELLDMQIVFTLITLSNYKMGIGININSIDKTDYIDMIWEEDIDIRLV